MPEYIIETYFPNSGSRNDIRKHLVDVFLKETPGIGRDDEATRYTYYVETLNDGNRVYLRRPANLHNGFDFLVCVENMNYAEPGKRNRNYPKHDDFEADLLLKREENPQMYRKLYTLLEKVYNCEEVTDKEITSISFSSGFEVDHIVKTVKWLFIEQDIRYWNYSGRKMTWGKIPEPN